MTAQTMTMAQMLGRVGDEVGVSRWFEIGQARIDAHAQTTEDWQFIHVDPARARAETPFGGTIAHGFLTLSLLSAMSYDAIPRLMGVQMGVNYGLNAVRFLSPVPAGARIRGRFTLRAAEERKPGEVTMVWAVTVEIEGQHKPALVAEWLGRQYLG